MFISRGAFESCYFSVRSGSKGSEKRTQKRSPLKKPSEKAQKSWPGRERENHRGEEGRKAVKQSLRHHYRK